MALIASVDWAVTKVITVSRADMPVIQASPEIRQLDVDALRLELKDLEDDVDGRLWPKTHIHNTQIVISGIVYERSLQIIAPYTITLEDGQYSVATIGANHNIADINNKNQVSLIVNNSAGLTNQAEINAVYKAHFHRRVHDDTANTITIFEADGVTPLYVFDADDGLTDIDPQFTP